jgi:sec-independent protein translocase protein TatA
MLSGIGGHLPEIIIVLVIILIIWGPGKLPSVGGAIGKGIREFRQHSSDEHEAAAGSTTAPTTPPTPVAGPVSAAVPAEAAQHQTPVSG